MSRKIITQNNPPRESPNEKNRFKLVCPALFGLLAFFAACAPDAAA